MTTGALPLHTSRLARAGATLAWISLIAAVLCALGALGAGPGYRLGLWRFGTGIKFIGWSAIAALAALVLALIAYVLAHLRHARRARIASALAIVIAVLTAAPPLYLYWRATHLPAIHDISTDTTNPPQFVAVLPLRQGANPLDYSAKVAAKQKQAYPDLQPALLALRPAQALERAEGVARDMNWQIVAVDAAAGRLEATASTWLFGFKDDVVVRVTPSGDGSRVDVRSTSRVGASDLGTNADRVRQFLARLRQAQ